MSKKDDSTKPQQPKRPERPEVALPKGAKVTRGNFDPSQFVTAQSAPPRVVQARTLYDRQGKPTSSESEAVAKTSRGTCYVRFTTAGREPNRLLDPLEDGQGDLSRLNKATGRQVFEWRAVTERAFDFYLKYLETQNKAYYLNAARS